MKIFYVICCVVGTVAPYSKFVPWIIEHGVAPAAFIAEAASTRIGAFAWLDVLVSAVVLLSFVRTEGRRLGIRRLWAPVLATLAVGVSLGLPLFLLLRQAHLEERKKR
jgi:hypothetical protein